MAGAVTGLSVFANQAGPIPLSQLDTNITSLTTAINSLVNFANYYADSSVSANTLTVTVPSPQVFGYVAGVQLQVKVANTNSGATVINVNALGNKSVLNLDGTALSAGQLITGMVVVLQYDGTNFYALNTRSEGRYLPLAGGTLTGTLNATSISMSSTLTVQSGNVIQLNNSDNTLAANILNSGGAGASILTFRTASVNRYTINDTGNHVISTPGAGTALAVGGLAASISVQVNQGSGGVGVRIVDPGANATRLDLFTTNTGAYISPQGSAAVPIAIQTSSTDRIAVGVSGNVTINAPSSGVALSVSGVAGSYPLLLNGASSTSTYMRYQVASSDNGFIGCAAGVVSGGSSSDFAIAAQGQLILGSNVSRAAFTIGTGGNVTISAPTSGAALTVNGTTVVTNNAGSSFVQAFDGSGFYTDCTGTFTSQRFYTNGGLRMTIAAAGNVTLNAPSSGVGFTANGGSGLITANFAGAAADSVRVEVTRGGGTAGTDSFALIQDTGSVARLFNRANAAMDFSTNGTQRVNIAAGGAVTINAPSSSDALTVTGGTGAGQRAATFSAGAGSTVGAVQINGNSTSSALGVTSGSGQLAAVFTGSNQGGLSVLGGSSTVNLACVQLAGNGANSYCFDFNSNLYTTGAAAPTLSSNKPGSAAGVIQWIRVSVGVGVTGWIPVFGN